MRSQNAIRSSFAPQLCIFCSLGFLGKQATPLTRRVSRNQRRYLNSSRPPRQSAAAAAIQVQQRADPLDESQENPGSFNGQPGPYNSPPRESGQSSHTTNQAYPNDGRNYSSSASSSSSRRSLSQAEERARQALLARSSNASQNTSANTATGFARTQSQLPGRLTAAEVQAREGLLARKDNAFRNDDQQPQQSQQYGQTQGRDDRVRSQYREQSYRGSHLSSSKYYRTQALGDRSSDTGNRTSSSESFSPAYRIKYHSAGQITGDPQYNTDSSSGSNWNSLAAEVKLRPNSAPQVDPRTDDYRQQSQQRWQSASSSAYVPLSEQRQNDAMRARFARKTCFRCGSTEHLANNCPTPNIRRAYPQTASLQPEKSDSRSSSARQLFPTEQRENGPQETTMTQPDAQSGRGQQDTYTSGRNMDPVSWAPRHRDQKEKDRRRANFVYEDEFDDEAPLKAKKGEKKASKAERAVQKAEKKAQGSPIQIYIPAFVSVANLATFIKVRTEDLVEKMVELGYGEVAHDEVLNAENAGLIAMEYNYEAIPERDPAVHDLLPQPEPDDKTLLPMRPPVVTIMGHVDHGKTTILDFLRKSSIAASEFGGITQHIGAFSVPLGSGKLITFLDTPGHAAFEVMRKRGATVTDIVVLVVAADDSVKPQTIEAIKHAKGAGVPIIVAINKMDKEEANPERVKGDLARQGVDVEDFGGDTQVVCVSGKTGLGIDALEESIATQSEILDHRAATDGMVEGWILESTTKRAGRVATVLVKRGTLHPGDILVAGTSWARVRVLRNEAGAQVSTAAPGTPIEVDGWRAPPAAGDRVLQASHEQKATDVVAFREEKAERVQLARDMEAINESRRLEQEKRERDAAAAAEAQARGVEAPLPPSEAGEEKATGPVDVNFLVKGDVAGSVEAVLNSISALAHPEVRPVILRSGVGPVSEFDVEHAAAASGYIVCFNTTVDPGMAQMAERKGVGLIEQNIIYRLVDEVKAKLSERLKPTVSTRVLGEAEVAQEFEIGVGGRKKMKIAGCKIRNGTISRTAKVRVLRGEREVVFDGLFSSLKNVKKDVSEMRKGTECGMSFENWEDFKIGDQVQCYEEKIEKRYL